MKTIWLVRRAAFARSLRAIAVSATRTRRNKQTTRPPRTYHCRSIGTVALLAGVFLLPAFAAQAQVNTVTTVTSETPNPSAVNQQVTFVVTVTAASGNVSPTGAVQLIDLSGGLKVVGTGTLAGAGAGVATTTITGTFNSPGAHSIDVSYGSDNLAAFTGSQTFVTQTVGTPTTTTLMSSPNPSQLNQSVTLTATVTATSGTATPMGSVTFTQSTTVLGTANLSGSGTAVTVSIMTTALQTGPVTATYNDPTGNFIQSTGTINQTVNNGSATTTALMSSPNPSQTNQSVTLTATVTNTGGTSTPTGFVTFSEGANGLGTGTLSGSGTTATASVMTTALVTGQVVATYQGVPGSFATSSGTVNQTVNNGDGTTTSVTANPNPSQTNQSVTLTATVTNTTGAATPTGMVSFTEGPNPSSLGQAVTFTATVTKASGNVNPTGTVTFKDNGTAIGMGTLSTTAGVTTASFTTTTPLTAGSHSITAVYSGDTNFSVSTSAALVQNVNSSSSSTDSIKLHQMQVSTTPVIAQAWGQTTAAAMDDAVSAGFGGNPASLSPAGTGFTYYFNDDAPTQRGADADQDSLRRYLASPNGSLTSPDGKSLDPKSAAANDSVKRVDDDFRTLGYAGGMATKAPPAPSSTPHDWLAWVTVRGTDYFRGTFGNDLKGDQVDALIGLTRRISPSFVVGAFGGYERFDYSSQAFNSVLKGDGWTLGGYLGWKLAPNIRLDAGAAWSDIFANDTAGTATGNFTGTRWLVNGGLTGTYPWQMLVLEPSARVFAIWEHENAFTDSLGTVQTARNFETGRASVGTKAIYPFAWTSSTVALSPYAGLYADYYFSKDDAQTVGLTTVPLLQGFSARATGGVAASFAGGATLGAGGEFGGIGSATHIWTWTARGRIPF